jgi:hypothetical protein
VQVVLATILAAGVAAALVVSASDRVPQVTRQFTATADAVLDSVQPQVPNGDTRAIRVDGSPAQWSLLRFDINGTSGGVSRAVLRLWSLSYGSGGTYVHTLKGGWTEQTTWATRPTVGQQAGRLPGHEADRWVVVDVSDAVQDNGQVNLLLSSTAKTAERFASRESGEHAPQLLVTAALAPGVHLATPSVPTLPTAPSTGNGVVRAAFYYPWFPEAWKQQGFNPFTNYHPTAGFYDSGTQATVDRTFKDLHYAGMNAVISSWWGPGTPTDARLPLLLSRAAPAGLSVAAYYEKEGTSDPSVSTIRSDLTALTKSATSSPSYLRVGGNPVVFVYGDPKDGCGMARRWAAADKDLGLYVVLKVFPGYQSCDAPPDAWHQYSPAVRSVTVGTDSVSVSPGFWKKGDAAPRLARDPVAFDQAVAAMAASGAHFQLVTTYNEWGEGTSVESAKEWGTPIDPYLEALHRLLALDPVIAAAGDIACTAKDPSYKKGAGTASNCRQRATSDLLTKLDPTVVLPLGDIQYECGEATGFRNVFDPTWGRLKERLRPAIGNHEYGKACGKNDPSAYFDYFGTAAGTRYQGWYSYDIGTWHIIALNSECQYGKGVMAVGGCAAGSPQESWLRQDLAAHPNLCTLAYWHEPRWSSGQHGDAQQMATIWNDLVAGKADVVLSGHNHDYERFALLGAAPQIPQPAASPGKSTPPSFQQPVLDPNGVREFVVGTGGKNHYGFAVSPLTGQQVRNDTAYGVLSMTLHPTGYDWNFLSEPGKSFTDKGSDVCH